MNLNVIRLGPVKSELAGIRKALERLADAYEMELAHKGLYLRAPVADTSGPEPEAVYSDEEVEWVREQLEAAGKLTPEVERRLFGMREDVSPENH